MTYLDSQQNKLFFSYLVYFLYIMPPSTHITINISFSIIISSIINYTIKLFMKTYYIDVQLIILTFVAIIFDFGLRSIISIHATFVLETMYLVYFNIYFYYLLLVFILI